MIRKSGTVLLLLLLAAFVAGGDLLAQGDQFTVTVDPTTVQAGGRIDVTFILNGSGGGDNFRPPSFADFQILSGPNQSTNMQILNGAVSSSVSYGYILSPKAEGKFTIGAATIEVGGKTLATKPVVVTVTKGAPPQKGAPGQQGGGEDASLTKQISDNLFLKVTVDKTRAVQGEQITATYKLYNRTRLINLGIDKTPALTGFWSEDLEDIKQVKFTQEMLDGKRYDVAVVKKVALFPQRSGTLEIDPMEVKCVVQVQSKRRSNDIFDQLLNDPFFGGGLQNVNHTAKSDPVKIAVAPLPSSGVPAGFGGAVGKFGMESWLDKTQTKTNEPVTLRVKITGTGNLKLLQAPVMNVPPDLEKYDPKISDNISHQGEKVSGSRTFEYLLIPRHAGEQKIPSFPFSYYDIERKSYVTLNSPNFSIDVAKGNDMAAAAGSGLSKEEVKLLGEDIRFIRSDPVVFSKRGDMFAGSGFFYLLSAAPVAAFAALVFGMKKRREMLGDVLSVRNRKARKMAQKRLVEAKKCLDAKKTDQYYTEISRALWGYAADKLGLPPAELSTESVGQKLEEKRVPPDQVRRLIETIQQCEFARFAPAGDQGRLTALYNETVQLISSIEESL